MTQNDPLETRGLRRRGAKAEGGYFSEDFILANG